VALASNMTLAEHVCLALVAEAPSHGWTVARALEESGPIGRIWTLTRPNTYRTIDLLVGAGLLRRADAEPGSGASRVPLHATAAGKRQNDWWLDTPVEHVRDVRTALLLKLTLRARSHREIAEFCRRQRAHLLPKIEAIATQSQQSTDPVELWRSEQAAAVLRFLDRVEGLPNSAALT
jgi:DNA-binding PadR family transcriptional regulator